MIYCDGLICAVLAESNTFDSIHHLNTIVTAKDAPINLDVWLSFINFQTNQDCIYKNYQFFY